MSRSEALQCKARTYRTRFHRVILVEFQNWEIREHQAKSFQIIFDLTALVGAIVELVYDHRGDRYRAWLTGQCD